MTEIKRLCILVIILVIGESSLEQVANPFKVSSPDNLTSIEVGTDNNGKLMYRQVFPFLRATLIFLPISPAR